MEPLRHRTYLSMTPDTLAILIAYMLGIFVLGLAIGLLYDNITKEWKP